MKWKALIFDVDGTLAETEEGHRQAFNEAFAEWGLGWRWDEHLYKVLLETTGGKERIRAFQQSYPVEERLSDDRIAALHRRKTELYADILSSGGLSLRPGVEAIMTEGRRRGARLAIATTTSLPNVDALCQCIWGQAASDVFDVIAAGDQVRRKKPAPDVYLLALERLGLPANECIAFEDSEAGLQSALAAGLKVCVAPARYTADQDFTGAMSVADTLEHGLHVLTGR